MAEFNIKRTGFIDLFTQMRRPTGFLQRFFTVKPGGIYSGENVVIDIQRFGEDVAVALKNCTGPNINDADLFTTKEFPVPSYGESFPLNVCDLLNRMAGVDSVSAAYTAYAGQLLALMNQGFTLIDDKISRAIELQASQIFQTGTVTSTNADGDVTYTLDFKAKATHFPTTGTSWGDASPDPLGDLESLANVIRADGKVSPDQLIMGATALKNFLFNDDVQKALDKDKLNIAEMRPMFNGSGATFYGFVWVGAYRFEIWTYPETYTSPETGLPVEYIATDKVVMLSSTTRLDRASALVPLPLGPDPRVAGLLPGRLSSRDAGFDVTPNIYPTPNGKQIMGELESRTLLIPVQIDGFGCLDTEI